MAFAFASTENFDTGTPTHSVASHSVDIARSARDVYALVVDFAGYPRFVPNQSGTRVISREGERWQVEFELSVVGRRVHYTLNLEGAPGEGLRWHLVEGQMMRSNDGGWTFLTLPNGGTRATCWFDIQFRGFLPRTLTNFLIGRTLPKNLDAFKREAERRQEPVGKR